MIFGGNLIEGIGCEDDLGFESLSEDFGEL
jgi:hypothetical protein